MESGELASDGSRKLTFTGISLLHRRLFAGLDDNAGKLGPILRRAMARGRISGRYHGGGWVDVGTPERLRELDRRLSAQEA